MTRGDELVQRRVRNRIEIPTQDHITKFPVGLTGFDHPVDLCQHDGQLSQLHVAPLGVEKQVGVGHAEGRAHRGHLRAALHKRAEQRNYPDIVPIQDLHVGPEVLQRGDGHLREAAGAIASSAAVRLGSGPLLVHTSVTLVSNKTEVGENEVTCDRKQVVIGLVYLSATGLDGNVYDSGFLEPLGDKGSEQRK